MIRIGDAPRVRRLLIGTALALTALFLLLPLVAIFAQALMSGIDVYWQNLSDAYTLSAIGLTLLVAFNYGGRDEIVRACQALAERVKAGELDPSEIDEDALEAQLDTAGIPDPDLIIRTSGENRLSNFTMWQAAYSEFVFMPQHWPDFDEAALESAIREFFSRDRRFGGLAAGMTGG